MFGSDPMSSQIKKETPAGRFSIQQNLIGADDNRFGDIGIGDRNALDRSGRSDHQGTANEQV